MRKIAEIRWKEAQEKMISLGVRVVTDSHPTTTVSGERDGGRFSLCWFEDTSTAFLEIEKIADPDLPCEDLFVKTISEHLMKAMPFCIYRNRNRKNLFILEWRKANHQVARLLILQGMRDVSELRELYS